MKISSKKELDERIIELEKKKIYQRELIKDQYQETVESLRPANLIKGVFNDIRHSPAASSGILKTVAGLGIGMLTKNLFWGKSSSLIKRLLGNVLKIGVAKTAVSNGDKIKAYGVAIYNNLFKRKANNKEAD
ncbi:MAG: hypothetical protein ABI402_07620 [Ferruginibacter sp.]